MPRLEWAMLCDAASIHAGKAFILGAGTRNVTAPSLPIPWICTFVLNLSYDEADIGQTFRLKSTVTRDGEATPLVEMEAHLPAMRVPGSSPLLRPGVIFQFQFVGVPIQSHGLYHVRLFMDETELTALPFLVAPDPPPMGGTFVGSVEAAAAHPA
jgi:hypothetical protein